MYKLYTFSADGGVTEFASRVKCARITECWEDDVSHECGIVRLKNDARKRRPPRHPCLLVEKRRQESSSPSKLGKGLGKRWKGKG